jgi:hypothetical protein
MKTINDPYGLIQSGLPPEIAAQARGITREQQIAEALLAQSNQPLQGRQSGRYFTPSHPLEGVAKIVQAYMGRKGAEDADKKFGDLSAKYQQGSADAMVNYIRTRQGEPGRAPMLDPQETEQMADQGTPMPPNVGAVPGDPRRAVMEAYANPWLKNNPMVAADLAQMNRPPEKIDAGDRWILMKDGVKVGEIPKSATPDATMRRDTTLQTHTTPSANVLAQEGGRNARHDRVSANTALTHGTPSASAVMTDRRTRELHNTPSATSTAAADRPPAARPMSATAQKELIQTEERVQAASGAVKNLQQALKLNDKAMGFTGAGAVASAGTLLPEKLRPGMVDATNELDNLVIGSALPQLKTLFGGNPTEGERKVLIDLQGASSKSPSVRKGIIERSIAAVNRRIQFDAEKARRLREGSYFSNDGGAGAPPAPNVVDFNSLKP